MKRLVMFAVLGFSACPSGVVKDGGFDAGADADAGVDAGTPGPTCPADAGPPDGTYAAAHRIIPTISPAVSPSGVRRAVTLVTITPTNETLAPQLHAFVDALAASDWYATVGASYGLQRPPAVLHIDDAPPITTSMPHTSQVASYVAGVIQTHALPVSGDDVLYVLFMPPGSDLGLADGFHGALDGAPGSFAVAGRLPFTIDGESELDTLTVTMSHEIIEAQTNWNQRGLIWGPPPATQQWTGPIFDVWQIPNEVADVCAGTRVREPLDGGFLYQRVFSNDVAACGGGNSCVPLEAGPHYAVSVEQDWYRVQPGQTLEIPFTGWSTAPIGDWLVSTQVIGGSLQCGGAACPTLSVTTPLGAGSTGCTTSDGGVSAVSQALNNGVTGTLKVQVPQTMQAGNYTVIGLFTHRSGAGPTGCGAPIDFDYYHLWPVGIYVP